MKISTLNILKKRLYTVPCTLVRCTPSPFPRKAQACSSELGIIPSPRRADKKIRKKCILHAWGLQKSREPEFPLRSFKPVLPQPCSAGGQHHGYYCLESPGHCAPESTGTAGSDEGESGCRRENGSHTGCDSGCICGSRRSGCGSVSGWGWG
ncbi:hypothetical protein SAMN05216316_1734 [Nitrosovibrio sp. Nv6]|nr:hypothetical protein SAMN05216316_1734 [Nitrosovibrio sp. Nv6]